MNNTEQLRQLMTLDANMNTSDIEERFEQIAMMLFESFAIQKGEKKYLFKEIEFYFYNKNHRDIITHPRVSKSLCWYVNDFGGIDLNFSCIIKRESRPNSKGKIVEKYVLDDSAYFGGILIRQLISEDGCEVLNGPFVQNCLDAMMPQVLTVDFLFFWSMIMVWWAIFVNLVSIYLHPNKQ